MKFIKVGTLNTKPKGNVWNSATATSKNQVPIDMWDKEANPAYNPELALIESYDVPEFLYTNTFERAVEKRVPREGVWEFQADGTWMDVATIEDQLKALESKAILVVSGMIQAVIDNYNKAHRVSFKDIDAMPKYKDDPTYTHYQFAVDIIGYNKIIWDDYVRPELDKILGGNPIPTEAEFIAALPVYTGVL